MEDSERKSGEGDWLVTYSDLVTLLLVFFVLMYTLTPGVSKSTFEDFISYFQTPSSIIQHEKSAGGKTTNKKQIKKAWKELKKFLKKQDLSAEVTVKKTKDGVKVTLSDSLTFNSGSAIILPKAKMVLKKVAEIIGKDVRAVNVQGHTDNVPISRDSRYRSNWHLGAARAVSVVLYITRFSKLSPSGFEASSFGQYRPIASNKTPEGRRKNRRVDIYVRYKK